MAGAYTNLDAAVASRPNQLRGEYAVDEMLRVARASADDIRRIRPPVPQVFLPPTEFGYERVPPTIHDVLDTDAFAPQFRSWTYPDTRPRKRLDQAPAADPGLRNAFVGLRNEA